MFRYFRRNLPLVIVALWICIFAQLSVPVVAMIEQRMIDIIINGNMEGFYGELLWAGGIVAITALLYYFNALTQKRFQVRFEEGLRNDLYDGVMRQSFARFREKDTSEQMSIVRSHAATISNNLTRPIFVLISYGVMAAVVLGIMFYYSILLAVLSLVCAVFSMLLPLYFNRQLSGQLMEKLDKDAGMVFQLKEALNAHETIASFGVFSKIRPRFVKVSHALAEADYRMEVTVSLLENAARVMQKITWFASFLIAGGMAVHGDITVGTLVMFITLFGEFNACVTLYAQTVPILLSTRTDIKKILEIIDDKESGFDGQRVPVCKDRVEVINLSFQYSENVPVLEKLNLTIRRGEKIALMGASGCGKSTLVKLLSGYYTDYNGEIRYDGVELHELDIKKLRKLVTVIQQNTFIFNDTIRFNICLGETFSEEAIRQALRFSGVERFLAQIPGGLEGECGEDGSQLSGGQKQRIALARALIRGANILILDEGVSAVDIQTANEIEKELLSMRDLTLLTITHRMKDGLTEQYDRVLLMENGKLEERYLKVRSIKD